MGITRKILRKGSRVLQVLKGMVGASAKIYSQIVELCIVKYRDSETLYIGAKVRRLGRYLLDQPPKSHPSYFHA
jgi:hypothetical protein